MAHPRRRFDIFSMSFLDTICCAFGAIVLLYMVINAASGRQFQKNTADLHAEVDRVEQEVLEGYQNLAVLRNAMVSTDEETKKAQGMATRIIDETTQTKEQLADAEGKTISRREAIEKLKAELKSLEEGTRRLEGGSKSQGQPGTRVRGFEGEGDRQYLTGLKVGGERIFILVDASASMLDDTVVNVLRMRNMSPARKLLSVKWRRTVMTVDWLAAQIPEKGRFQIYAFNTKAWALTPQSEGKWLETRDANSMNDALRALREVVPQDGTSLENAFAALNAMTPAPDNVIMITDGLPTQATSVPVLRKVVSGEQRLDLFERAWRKYPRKIPFNVILMPMEGDPAAPSAFWLAARQTGGAFMSPSKDWP
ncbi:MAG TPA: hypothetical protein VJS42_11460 [Steroidobacteraceae bacterium]|nr:hypothetical protein [Steroidobacteraceae bacterium]